jgi:hypothetical protein
MHSAMAILAQSNMLEAELVESLRCQRLGTDHGNQTTAGRKIAACVLLAHQLFRRSETEKDSCMILYLHSELGEKKR